MKKIAFFLNNLNVGGIQKSFINMMKRLDYNNFEIDLYLVNKERFYNDEFPSKLNVIYIDEFPSLFKFLPFIFSKSKNINILPKDYDVAIDFDSYQNITAWGAIKTKAKHKVMWIHNDVEKKYKEDIKYRILHFFFKNKYKYFDTFVSVSDGIVKSFKQLNNIDDKRKFITIPNYIDTEEIINKSKEKVNFKVDKNIYNFVSIGRLCHQKGYDICLDLLYSLKRKRKDFHYYIIGDGPDRLKLETQIKELELTNYVTFLGNQNNPYNYAKLMDGLILTSRYEGQGMVLLEAICLGLEIFMPKHLEKYNKGLVGKKDMLSSLVKATKKRKTTNKLYEYNKNIEKELNNLFLMK